MAFLFAKLSNKKSKSKFANPIFIPVPNSVIKSFNPCNQSNTKSSNRKGGFMKCLSNHLAALAITGLFTFAPNRSNAQMNDSTNISKSESFRLTMNKLWEGHITWTRNVIFCLVDNLPGADQAVQRLLKNQDDIGDAIKSYYGDDAGKKLQTCFTIISLFQQM
jgi:hypothetical protein